MTGPEHYLEAEEHLEAASKVGVGSTMDQYHLSAAQVHATLALAAAQAFSNVQLADVAEFDVEAPWPAEAWMKVIM